MNETLPWGPTCAQSPRHLTIYCLPTLTFLPSWGHLKNYLLMFLRHFFFKVSSLFSFHSGLESNKAYLQKVQCHRSQNDDYGKPYFSQERFISIYIFKAVLRMLINTHRFESSHCIHEIFYSSLINNQHHSPAHKRGQSDRKGYGIRTLEEDKYHSRWCDSDRPESPGMSQVWDDIGVSWQVPYQMLAQWP